MEYEKYKAVVECNSADEAQDYLDLGWELLCVGRCGNSEESHMAYSLGWSRDNGEVKNPSNRELPYL